MRTLLVSALAFGATTSIALAAPVALTEAQMDTVTAGAEVGVFLTVHAIENDIRLTAGQLPQNGPSTTTPDCLIWDVGGADPGVTGSIQIMIQEPRAY